MTRRLLGAIACVLMAVTVGAAVWAQSTRPVTPAEHNALVDEYCVSCHSKASKSGDLVLEGFDLSSPLLGGERLELLIRKLRSGQMPPASAEQPSPEAKAALVAALETKADTLAARRIDPGERPFQRLNRAEYTRVIKDLLAIDVDAAAILPPDTASGGFDNIADVQVVSPALVTAYLRGAATVSRLAVGKPTTATSRRQLFVCSPRTPATERACATEILRKLTSTAYRGAAAEPDLDDALMFFDRGRKNGGFDEGIRLALQSVLMSPKFLFRIEPASPTGELTDVALASRLSFFLWSTAPDATLIAAARQGQLHTSDQLALQVRRMLADPRAESLSTRFAAQWLRLQDLEKNQVDRVLYPSFDTALAKAMRRETELVVANLVRRDGAVTDLLTFDRSFVNERLAKHYGIPNVRGAQFREVVLPETRRGLLGQGSVLTLTSLGNRTSPVLRGKWVLDVLLGTPPPPPPPNVPALDDTAKAERDGVTFSTRQRVEEHRKNPSCSGCHRVIDPPGMALENFDATGAWRTVDNGVPVDAASQLYDGTRMEGAAGLRAALISHQDLVLRNCTQQLMTYALGRRLSYRDMPAVRAIVNAAAVRKNAVSAFIIGVVTSDAFRKTRTSGAS